MDEFSMIAKYFAPLTEGRLEAAGLCDDAAVLDIPAGQKLVVSSDTLNEGVHFLAGADPAALARKALRVNLSDLTAMGARPYAYQLCMTYPEAPREDWLGSFTGALLADQQKAGIFCSGGDTTRGEKLSITITVMGVCEKPIPRQGAQVGDVLVVTGALGLAEVACNAGQVYVPPMRCDLVDILQRYARACIDISDGLYQDVGHMGVDVLYDRTDYPSFGEDYELAIAVAPADVEALLFELSARGCAPFVAGAFVEQGSGSNLRGQKQGFSHF